MWNCSPHSPNKDYDFHHALGSVLRMITVDKLANAPALDKPHSSQNREFSFSILHTALLLCLPCRFGKEDPSPAPSQQVCTSAVSSQLKTERWPVPLGSKGLEKVFFLLLCDIDWSGHVQPFDIVTRYWCSREVQWSYKNQSNVFLSCFFLLFYFEIIIFLPSLSFLQTLLCYPPCSSSNLWIPFSLLRVCVCVPKYTILSPYNVITLP